MLEANGKTALYWFRRDLRLADNSALAEAAKLGLPLLPVFVIEPDDQVKRASFWWLCRSLEALAADLEKQGQTLIVLAGDPLVLLPELAKKARAGFVAWSRTFEPSAERRDDALQEKLLAGGISVHRANDRLLFMPEEVRNQSGQPFRVFTPFWRACRLRLPKAAVAPPPHMPPPPAIQIDERVDPANLARYAWARGFAEHWRPGEAGALARLDAFLGGGLENYARLRDRPDIDGTSRLSAHLHWGEIAPRRILAELDKHVLRIGRSGDGAEKFLAELGWREFAHHLLNQFPEMARLEFKNEFRGHPWKRDEALFEAWRKGRTGVPIVDAGLRQLWATGWMHNRVRMVAASFLVKQMQIDWRLGLSWFDDTLVDACPANNPCGWQWVAGTGADAAPYFRIFNPVLQGRKFDPDGDYVCRWLPELAKAHPTDIHAPWLDGSTPKPIIDLAQGRAQALAARKRC